MANKNTRGLSTPLAFVCPTANRFVALATNVEEDINAGQSDPTYGKWNEQTDDKFGFIPLGPLVIAESDKRRYMGSDPIKLYEVTKAETKPNFLSAQIQVDSQLNGGAWETLLGNYWDQQLPF